MLDLGTMAVERYKGHVLSMQRKSSVCPPTILAVVLSSQGPAAYHDFQPQAPPRTAAVGWFH